MSTLTNQKPYPREDFSGAIQRKTIKFMKRANEVDLAINASFERIGGVEKVSGMSLVGNMFTTTSTSTTTSSTSSSTSSSSTTTP